MHETIIAHKIIEEAQKYGDVVGITIEVGDLAHLPANEMKEVMEGLTDWKINVTETKAKVKCECGYEGRPKIIHKGHDSTLFECPKCRKVPKIIKGDEIILKEVKVK